MSADQPIVCSEVFSLRPYTWPRVQCDTRPRVRKRMARMMWTSRTTRARQRRNLERNSAFPYGTTSWRGRQLVVPFSVAKLLYPATLPSHLCSGVNREKPCRQSRLLKVEPLHFLTFLPLQLTSKEGDSPFRFPLYQFQPETDTNGILNGRSPETFSQLWHWQCSLASLLL